MGIFREGLVILFNPEDEFRRGQDDGNHRLGTGLPRPTGGLGSRKHLGITLNFRGGGGPPERAAHEKIHHRTGPVIALLALGERRQLPLQIGARVGGSEQLITIRPETTAA